MKAALIISENKKLEGILAKTVLVLFRYQDESRKLWNNWSKSSRAVRAGALVFGPGEEAVGAREGSRAPTAATCLQEGIEMVALGSLCGGRTKDNEPKLKEDRFRLDVQKIFSTTKTFKLPQKLRCLHPWRFSSSGYLVWPQNCPCCEQEAGQEPPEASLPALWSCQLQEAHCRDTGFSIKSYIY